VFACELPLERRKRISTRRAKELHKKKEGKKFRLILNDDPRNHQKEGNNAKAYTKIFKRFKLIIQEQIKNRKQEIAEKNPKTCSKCSGLLTMMNMAYKIVK